MKHLPGWLFIGMMVFGSLPSVTGVWTQSLSDRWLIGLHGGYSIYAGELSKGDLGTLRGVAYRWGGAVYHLITPNWALGIRGHTGTLVGEDDFYPEDTYRLARNFSFETEYADLAVSTLFYPFGERRLRPELGVGIGVLFFSSNASLLDNTHLELADLIKDDLQATDESPALIVPLRLGMMYRLTDHFSLTIGMDYIFTTTDRLDGVSFAGDPETNDRYGSLSLGLRYHFGAPSDLDEDGIADVDDSCPLAAGPALTLGCPDADGDGVRDEDDRCPLAAGDPFFGGCPDTDEDGTPDPRDRCPAIFGPPETLGCPPQDTDNDGIFDHLDDCPVQPGPVERRGCPAVDTDADGLLDEDDRCPERFGIELFKGCPDTDGDGIEDNGDACPNTFGRYEEGGCPLFGSSAEEAATLMQQRLFFRLSSVELDNFPLLDHLVDFLQRNPAYRLTVNGHADGIYDEAPEYISQLRAERVKRYLVDSGINADRIQTVGHRDRQPFPQSTLPADQRRVELDIY